MKQILIDLVGIIIFSVYGVSILGCASILQNRDCSIAALPIGIIPVVNTAYMIYRWDDCKWVELFEGCKTNLLEGVDNL